MTAVGNPINRDALLKEIEEEHLFGKYKYRKAAAFVANSARKLMILDERCDIDIVQSQAPNFCAIVKFLTGYFIFCDVNEYYGDACRQPLYPALQDSVLRVVDDRTKEVSE